MEAALGQQPPPVPVSASDLERALHFDGSWYEAIKSKDAALVSALIQVRGPGSLKGVVAGLHHAVFDGNRAIVEIFLHNGCDVNGRDTAYCGVTPLMEAVRKEDLGAALLLLEHGARLDLLDSCHDNVMHWAARYTSGSFLRRFLALAESRGGVPRSVLMGLATAKNGKHLTPSDVAKSAMLRAYLQRFVDRQQQQPLPVPPSQQQQQQQQAGPGGRSLAAHRPSSFAFNSALNQSSSNALGASVGHSAAAATGGGR